MDKSITHIREFMNNLAKDDYVAARESLRGALVDKMRDRMLSYEKSIRNEHNGNICWVGKSK